MVRLRSLEAGPPPAQGKMASHTGADPFGNRQGQRKREKLKLSNRKRGAPPPALVSVREGKKGRSIVAARDLPCGTKATEYGGSRRYPMKGKIQSNALDGGFYTILCGPSGNRILIDGDGILSYKHQQYGSSITHFYI